MHTYERQDPFIQEVLAFAKAKNLDLSSKLANYDPKDLELQEYVDPSAVKALMVSIDKEGGWPKEMPLPIVLNWPYPLVIDGSHRVTAARANKLKTIPVIVLSTRAYEGILNEFGIPSYDYLHSILPAIDPLMAENSSRDRKGGSRKNRTASPTDMDAFL